MESYRRKFGVGKDDRGKKGKMRGDNIKKKICNVENKNKKIEITRKLRND